MPPPDNHPSRRSKPPSPSPNPPATTTTTPRPARNTPYLPTPTEFLLLALYPFLLLLGALYALLSPTTRNAPYDAASHSHPPAHAPSYFARKDNVFNTLFVKKGWGWITAA
ncbi:hypothetical protein C8A05DRAFT_36369, partial [Staphylotrichum tortipilum]